MDDDIDESLKQTGEPSVKTWPSEILSEFIAAYQSMPQLWDPTHEHYTSQSLRNKNLVVMRDIYRKFYENATIVDVKRKINSLRCQYRKDYKKRLADLKSGCSEDKCYKPRNWVFYALQFLHSVMQLDSQEGDEHNETAKGEGDQQNTSDSSDHTDRLADSHEDIERVPPDSPKSPKKKRVKRERTEEYLVPLSEPCTYGGYNSENNRDDLVAEVEVWVNKLNKLQPMQRLYAEKAINDVLFEAQLGNLTTDLQIGTRAYSDPSN